MEQIAFPRYEQYKPSGLDWIGELPAHWNIIKNKYIFKERDERNSDQNLTHFSLSKARGLIEYSETTDKDARAENLSLYKKFNIDDLVMNKMQAWNGVFGYACKQGIVSPDYTVFTKKSDINVRFYEYLFKTDAYISQFLIRSRGMGDAFKRLNTPEFGAIFAIHPPKKEQDAITNFLDQKTAEIDKAIAKKQRLIELLKEQKAILINQAVTKGLNPKAPMRDSGAHWIGDIPEHWNITRLKFATKFIVDCLHATPEYKEDGDYPAIRTADIIPGHVKFETAKKVSSETFFKWTERALPRKNDILYSREGERYGIAAPVPDNIDLCISQRMMHFRSSHVFNPIYLMWQLNCQHVYNQASVDTTGATSPHVNISTIKNYLLVVPPIEEQIAINSCIDQSVFHLESAIVKTQKEIEMIQELKITLISEAVTGKIKL